MKQEYMGMILMTTLMLLSCSSNFSKRMSIKTSQKLIQQRWGSR